MILLLAGDRDSVYCLSAVLQVYIRGNCVYCKQMKNIDMTIEENILTIRVDLRKEFGVSKSGKSITIASTEGNVSLPEHEDIKIGLNIYRKK